MAPVTIVKEDPVVAVLADMILDEEGVLEMARWIAQHRPQCVPAGGFGNVYDLLPHDGYEDLEPGQKPCNVQGLRRVTDNELLAEIAGRKCYDSFAEKAARRTNREYLESMWVGRIPHRSTGYHPHMTFFFANVSRRVSHEILRNYIGHAKDEEGAPSQESTRFTHHPGTYVVHPADLQDPAEVEAFAAKAQHNYDEYCAKIERKVAKFKEVHGGEPKGLDRKRIYEASAGDLLMSCGTSWVWTTNPMAMAKFFAERCDQAADMEMARFAEKWRRISVARWPNLFSFAAKQ